MARTALTAPAHVVLQRSPGQFGTGSSVSPDAAISMDYLGGGMLDHRMAFNVYNSLGNGALAGVVGFANGMYPCVMDATIATATTTGGVAAAANVSSGVAMTLSAVTTLTANVVLTSSALTTYPFGTVIPSGTLVMESQMGYLTVGTRDITAAYDPTKMATHNLIVTGVSGTTGGLFIVRGWDVYGQVMAEEITATAGAASVSGKKAFKWIKSITPQFTDAHNYSWDVGNVFGLHLAADAVAYVDVWDTTSGFNTNPTFVGAITATNTATNGDVRGTVSVTPAGHRVVVFVTPSAARLMQANPNNTGLWGQTQFTE